MVKNATRERDDKIGIYAASLIHDADVAIEAANDVIGGAQTADDAELELIRTLCNAANYACDACGAERVFDDNEYVWNGPDIIDWQTGEVVLETGVFVESNGDMWSRLRALRHDDMTSVARNELENAIVHVDAMGRADDYVRAMTVNTLVELADDALGGGDGPQAVIDHINDIRGMLRYRFEYVYDAEVELYAVVRLAGIELDTCMTRFVEHVDDASRDAAYDMGFTSSKLIEASRVLA